MIELICSKRDRCKLGEDCPHKLRPPAVCYEYEHKKDKKPKKGEHNENWIDRR